MHRWRPDYVCLFHMFYATDIFPASCRNWIWYVRSNQIILTLRVWEWIWIWIMVFNATFSIISAISWRPVLVVEEGGVPGENHRPWGKQLVNFITCGCESSAPLFVIYKAGREPTPYDRLVWVARSNDLTHWATWAP